MAQYTYTKGSIGGSTRQERAANIRTAMRASQAKGDTGRVDISGAGKKKSSSSRTSFAGVKSPAVEQAIVERMAERGDIITSGRGAAAQAEYVRQRDLSAQGYT
ncbi:MAG TPA: hypothetical protein VMV86_02100, partial [Methanosarcinales archaeon]|nr:hypothetical protein [Methanosarcinales archaeon]